MSMKWFALIVFVYVIGLYLGATFENANTTAEWGPGGGSAGLSESPLTTLQNAVQMKNLIQEQPLLGGAITIPLPNTDIFTATFKILTGQFDFVMYDDLGRMFYQHVLLPFVVASVASIAVMFYGMVFGNITWG